MIFFWLDWALFSVENFKMVFSSEWAYIWNNCSLFVHLLCARSERLINVAEHFVIVSVFCIILCIKSVYFFFFLFFSRAVFDGNHYAKLLLPHKYRAYTIRSIERDQCNTCFNVKCFTSNQLCHFFLIL